MVKKVVHKHYHYHYGINKIHKKKKDNVIKKALKWTQASYELHRKHLKRAVRIMNMKIIDYPKVQKIYSKWATEELEKYFKMPRPVKVMPNTSIMAIIYKVYFNFMRYDTFDKLFHVRLKTLTNACKLMFEYPNSQKRLGVT